MIHWVFVEFSRLFLLKQLSVFTSVFSVLWIHCDKLHNDVNVVRVNVVSVVGIMNQKEVFYFFREVIHGHANNTGPKIDRCGTT